MEAESEIDGGPVAANEDVTGEESDGNPTVSGLTAGGTGTDIGPGSDVGGAQGSGGGVVDRVGSGGTVGGEVSGVGGSSVGAGIPPEPPPPPDAE